MLQLGNEKHNNIDDAENKNAILTISVVSENGDATKTVSRTLIKPVVVTISPIGPSAGDPPSALSGSDSGQESAATGFRNRQLSGPLRPDRPWRGHFAGQRSSPAYGAFRGG